MKPLSLKIVFRQLRADLIGKDSHRGVTLTYTWLANQWGHFGLGFVPTFILYQCLRYYTGIQQPGLWSALIVSVAWLLFETYNFLGPLLLSGNHPVTGDNDRPSPFGIPWGNIASDTVTDLLFFWSGASYAAFQFYIFGSQLGAGPTLLCLFGYLALLLLLLFFPGYFWYTTKIFLQEAEYPIQFRLCQWDRFITEADQRVVNRFIAGTEERGNHLLIFGAEKSGKTSIGVAIATERSIGRCRCAYTTAMNFFQKCFMPDEALIRLGRRQIWTWRQASLLVIDDINVRDPASKEAITPELFRRMLVNPRYGARNLEAIRAMNGIWVLGNEAPRKDFQDQWLGLLLAIGIPADRISAIDLSGPPP